MNSETEITKCEGIPAHEKRSVWVREYQRNLETVPYLSKDPITSAAERADLVLAEFVARFEGELIRDNDGKIMGRMFKTTDHAPTH